MSEELVLGIDPGYARLGWAVVSKENGKFQLHGMGCILTSKKESLLARYRKIQQEFRIILRRYQPTQASMETLFFQKNQTTALQVSEVRGLLFGELFHADIQVSQYGPSQVKLAVAGSGRADKTAMMKMVGLQLSGISPELKSQLNESLDDTFDAVAIGMTHLILEPLQSAKSTRR